MLPTASLTISDLLSGPYLLNVPVYQRPYSWDREHAEQLFDDLIDAVGLGGSVEAAEDYFLGNILLMDSPGNVTTKLTAKMTAREFDVVDGQQRLVTLLILFAVMRDLETSAKKPLGKRVQAIILAQRGGPFFRTERLRLHLTSQDRPLFESFVLQPGSTLQAPAGDKLSLSEAALVSVRDLFVRELSGMTEAERAGLFEFVTERGYVTVTVSHDIDRAHRTFVVLNERGKKLQRNDILKADLLSRLATANVPSAVKAWDDASAELGSDFETFFAHLRAIYGYARPQIVSGVRAIVRDAGGAELFLKTVFLPLTKSYAIIRRGGVGVLPPEMARYLMYLNRIPEGDWAPAAMLALKDWEKDPAAAERILGDIDRLAHLLRLLGTGGGKRIRRFAGVATAIRSGEKISDTSPAFQLTRDECRNVAFHLRDLHKRNPKPCKLVLLRLNDEIGGTMSAVNPEDYTVEHVLPQRPPPTSEWRSWFPSAEERSKMIESLGNLVLITPKQNEKARNASFAAKKDIYAVAESGAPLLDVTRDVLEMKQWRSLEIEAREDRLIKIIEKIWRIDLNSARSPVAPAIQQASAQAAQAAPNDDGPATLLQVPRTAP